MFEGAEILDILKEGRRSFLWDQEVSILIIRVVRGFVLLENADLHVQRTVHVVFVIFNLLPVEPWSELHDLFFSSYPLTPVTPSQR